MEEIIRQKRRIREVYFSWGGFANGRNSQLQSPDFPPWEAQSKMIGDLRQLCENGLKFNLLFNGNCYGKDSLSRKFFSSVGETALFVRENFGLDSVTTTSPLIAKFIKENFAPVEVRASVNMGIGSIEGMDYLGGVFDGYYMQREHNRDFKKIKELKRWCAENGKKLYLLANSGCLNHCSAHTFHDNLVSHEAEISAMDNAYEFEGLCRSYLRDRKKWGSLVFGTNYIRPEEIHKYDAFFDAAKLATRVNANPARVLRAYINGGYAGNLLNLLEPDHSGALYPYVLENSLFPKDFIERSADRDYCEKVLENALVDTDLEENLC